MVRLSSALLPAALLLLPSCLAASKEDWKGRTIYQLLTDRFAPPSATAPALTNPIPEVCDPNAQTWCGGNYRSIVDRLDYIQDMGMTAIWISPVNKNIDDFTKYGFAYHGYWVSNPTELNPRFGTADDLKYLIAEVHKRGMYIMVDIVINNVPINADPRELVVTEGLLVSDGYLFTKPEDYHPYCPVDYTNDTSAEICWLGDTSLALMDVNTELPEVISTYNNWIKSFVEEYGFDGLRIDAAKHVPETFWPDFCAAAGVYCIGEVFAQDMPTCKRYADVMDGIMNYPVYFGMMDAFQLPGPANMSSLVDVLTKVNETLPDTHALGVFIENHDLPRFANTTVDPQLQFTTLAFQFVIDGIPIVYYGQEQGFRGIADPSNREPLWPSNYANTTDYQRITLMNDVRKHMHDRELVWQGKTFQNDTMSIVQADARTVAIRKGPLLSVLTTRGAPPTNESFGLMNAGWDESTVLVDVFSCEKFVVGSGNSFLVNYGVRGGRPVVTLPLNYLNGSDICLDLQRANRKTAIVGAPRPTGGALGSLSSMPSVAALAVVLGSMVGLALF